MPGVGGTCFRAGASFRGFVIGYDIYSLPVGMFPNPTLREFLVNGYLAHADALAVDFNVRDADGTQGSDLDPTDSLVLRNPDGLPDTGDEVLVFTDVTAGAPGTTWYRVQPVVAGSQAFFDAGTTCNTGVAAARLDLDGNRVPESVDIFVDGIAEFIDPSLRGLGLTHAGEILSSPAPGIGEPERGHSGCDGAPVRDGETDCANRIDDDADGDADCDDSDCASSPACMEGDCSNGLDDDNDGDVDCDDSDCTSSCPELDCRNGIDDDGDGRTDCEDPDCMSPCPETDCTNGVDDDGDGQTDCADSDCTAACSESDCWNGVDDDMDGSADCDDFDCTDADDCRLPHEVMLFVERSTPPVEAATLRWTEGASGPNRVFDVVSGSILSLRDQRGVSDASCLVEDASPLEHRDVRPVPRPPPMWTYGYFYLVREQSRRGLVATWGRDSAGNRREPMAAPRCAP
jgi:hypothetical protein